MKPFSGFLFRRDQSTIVLNLKSSYGWYDFTIEIKGNSNFLRQYAGRVETGKESFTDPLMGKVI